MKIFELKCTDDITVNERIKAEVVREAFRRLESSRNKTSADGLKKAFEQSQNCIRSHLELNQYKSFLESQFYSMGKHLPPIDEDKVSFFDQALPIYSIFFPDNATTINLCLDCR